MVIGNQEGRIFLVDSNILIYAYNEDSPYHQKTKEIMDKEQDG